MLTGSPQKRRARDTSCKSRLSATDFSCFTGALIGQAIAIHEWEFEDGTRGGPIAEANAMDTRQTKAAIEDLQQAGKSCCSASHALLLAKLGLGLGVVLPENCMPSSCLTNVLDLQSNK